VGRERREDVNAVRDRKVGVWPDDGPGEVRPDVEPFELKLLPVDLLVVRQGTRRGDNLDWQRLAVQLAGLSRQLRKEVLVPVKAEALQARAAGAGREGAIRAV